MSPTWDDLKMVSDPPEDPPAGLFICLILHQLHLTASLKLLASVCVLDSQYTYWFLFEICASELQNI